MTLKCKVKSIEPLACNTYKILLQSQNKVDFQAGQYLMVVMGEKDKRPFSIASSPSRENNELELHIGAAEHNAYALEVVELMKKALENGESVDIDAPHGDAYYQSSNEQSVLLIAGGTGFSYVRSILDHCISQNASQPIYLYWGAKDDCQLYARKELEQIAASNSNVIFVPVVEVADETWSGKTGNVLQAIHSDFDSLAKFDIYIAGRFEMAGAAREQFTTQKQAQVDRMFADAYAFI